MDMHSEKIRKKYNRAARFYDILETPMEMMALVRILSIIQMILA